MLVKDPFVLFSALGIIVSLPPSPVSMELDARDPVPLKGEMVPTRVPCELVEDQSFGLFRA